ncbi:rhamnogalacturonyl hydrolase YesR [Sphingobacterium allocomposti]|jgi:unsaturated rhamnogalacturonyl hydrolase|uniref:Rhamnogalacturonyl hydrolase YesR n=1 Tax=Sphingobacterium allocomposti TaxID=415956 RepID=A0A5S5DR96_9SPHI|nr:glycoside hydrolase family 88 protein [Sphingobacterium composti Yoo et al. 2007 non Ten et al. 2007]TYP98407.1 rhamnogalacturonyl hydrolase YesR [Sphingobacterium composti Yoo et al. 2007 non Ten et al. 2007]HLS96796.1 glycoside hydrolase family 88 protein [Sphingobacterium sp.]
MIRIKNKIFFLVLTLALGACVSQRASYKATKTTPEQVLTVLRSTNAYFMQKWPDTGKPIYTNRWRPSNIWTRAVYYEGLMALYQIDPDKRYYDYAVDWGTQHKWSMRNGVETRNADDQACGQIYLDLYEMDPQPERMAAIKQNIDYIIRSGKVDDWTWIDAIQMAMPVFAKLGVMLNDERYFDYMYKMYTHTKAVEGGGLYNPEDKLWWRDKDFVPPYKEPNGEDCYWSRGNGWVVAALVRVLDILPETEKHRTEYLEDYKNLMEGVLAVQRSDGFWNVSLHDPGHFGGRETSGTALFAYGMAWGINKGILDATIYRPAVDKAWSAMVNEAVHPSGFLGYMQGTGKEPKDGQPVRFASVPDFEDYGLGCFLLAGSEYYKLLK